MTLPPLIRRGFRNARPEAGIMPLWSRELHRHRRLGRSRCIPLCPVQEAVRTLLCLDNKKDQGDPFSSSFSSLISAFNSCLFDAARCGISQAQRGVREKHSAKTTTFVRGRGTVLVIDVPHTDNMRRWFAQALENMGEYLRARQRCMNTMYFSVHFSSDPGGNSKAIVIVCHCKNISICSCLHRWHGLCIR